MNTHIKLLIFDLDGTLIDSGDDLFHAVNHTLTALKLNPLKKETIISFIGNGEATLLTRALGDEHKEKLDQAITIFSQYYQDHLLDSTDLYPGISEMLSQLREMPKVIITNKTHTFAVNIVENLRIAHLFDLIIGIDSTSYRKPDRKLIVPLMEKHALAAHEIVVIGDGVNDILLAKNSGTKSCAFLRGLTNRELLLNLNPDLTYEDPRELPSLINALT